MEKDFNRSTTGPFNARIVAQRREALLTSVRLEGLLNGAFANLYRPDSGFRLKVSHEVSNGYMKYILSEDRTGCDPLAKSEVPRLGALVGSQNFRTELQKIDYRAGLRYIESFVLRGEIQGLVFRDVNNNRITILSLDKAYV